MKEQERKDRASLPPCPNPTCQESHVVRNGSHQGRQRSHCRSCKTYFGQTQATPMYGLKTPAAEVAQALLILMRRGSLRAAEELTGHNYETSSGWLKRAATQAAAIRQVLASDLHLSQVEVDEFWSFVQKKRVQLSLRQEQDRICLQVSDDGCGYDPAQHHAGLGIFGMRERATLLGGTLDIQSQPGQGTTVQAVLPLPECTTREAPYRALRKLFLL